MKIAISILIVLILALAVFGQSEKNRTNKTEKPNFSGTWVLDKTRTKRINYDLTLIVAHREPELKVTADFDNKGEKRTEERVYYTDGRRLPDFKDDYENVSQESGWAGSSIVLKTLRLNRVEGSNLSLKRTTTEKWKISKDGQTLIVEVIETFPVGITPQSSRDSSSSNLGDVTREVGSVKVLKFKRATADDSK